MISAECGRNPVISQQKSNLLSNKLKPIETMRTIIKNLILSAALLPALGLTSCSSLEDGSYVDPITQYEKIGGTWVLKSITQVDETNSRSMTLTDQFDFESFSISLNTDADNEPTTFAVTGNAPKLLPASGTWHLDNPFVNSDGSPAVITLEGGQRLTVTAVPGATSTLEFKLTRTSGGNPFVSYVYNLAPAN